MKKYKTMNTTLFIRRYLLVLGFCLAGFFGNRIPLMANTQTHRDSSLIYVIDLKQDIDRSAMRKINMGIQQAVARQADFLIIDMNTYGGAVDAADSIRTALLQCPIPTISFINVQAASAGALISIACDSIYMRSGSSFGAATVVDQSGQVMPDKYQSFMRGMMRSTAEAHGKKWIAGEEGPQEVWHRDPLIAQQMTDTANVLTFTPEEAQKARYCEGMAESLEEVADRLCGEGYVLQKQELSWLHQLLLLLMSPLLQSLFLMMIIGGIYFEMQSPGIGFPLAIAIVGGLLYFAPLYLEGLAMHWEIALFIVGLVLLLIELFAIPGFGVFGILGLGLMFVSLVFSMVDNDVLYFEGTLNLQPVLKPILIVCGSSLAVLVVAIWGAGRFYEMRLFNKVALKTNLDESEGFVGVEKQPLARLVGQEALVISDLRPSGKVELDGKRYNAVLEYGSARKGDYVYVVRAELGCLYVRLIQR